MTPTPNARAAEDSQRRGREFEPRAVHHFFPQEISVLFSADLAVNHREMSRNIGFYSRMVPVRKALMTSLMTSATLPTMRNMFLVAALLSAGCAYHPPTQPTAADVVPTASTTPASIRLVAATRSDRQVDVVATVLTGSGGFVAGTTVTFSTSAGTLNTETVITDGVGTARCVLATTAAAQVRAQANGLEASIAVTGTPAPVTTEPPVAPVPPPTLPIAPLSVQLLITPSPAGSATAFNLSTQGTVTRAVWTFGDTSAASTTSAPRTTHVYPSAGPYTAGVTITDALGRSASATAGVVIAPSPDAPAPTTATLGVTLGCTPGTHLTTATACNLAASYGGTTLASNAITSVTWDMGDGTVTTVINSPLRSYTYGQAGTYLVTAAVTATTIDGSKTTTAAKTIIVP